MDPDAEKIERHCSFCFQVCSPAKVCSKCHKRAYCSRQCQAADWKPEGVGQGHKKWCQYECGEEDVDWYVVPVPGKGLGIVAKRMIRAGYRIIVEPVFTDPAGHPAIHDLMPEHGSLMEKLDLNSTLPDIHGQNPVVNGFPLKTLAISLRISRANHDCDPNAASFYYNMSRVMILVAQREIPADQEICISYNPISYITSMSLAENARFRKHRQDLLVNKWNIICSPDCVCNDSKVEKLILKAFALIKVLGEMEKAGNVPNFQPAEDLLMVLNSIPVARYSLIRGNAYFCISKLCLANLDHLFRHKCQDKDCKMSNAEMMTKLDHAKNWVQSSYEITSSISPFWDHTQMSLEASLNIRRTVDNLQILCDGCQ